MRESPLTQAPFLHLPTGSGAQYTQHQLVRWLGLELGLKGYVEDRAEGGRYLQQCGLGGHIAVWHFLSMGPVQSALKLHSQLRLRLL